MKEIVIISGKGGTGKTSITASYGFLGGKDVVVADCDVDAADMHLLMSPEIQQAEDFYSGVAATINPAQCVNCGLCATICRFDAISVVDNQHVISELNCEGCGYCEKICPSKAINMYDVHVGEWYISNTNCANSLVHAKLGIGADNSGKLVAKVKNEAKILANDNKLSYVIVDGSPGVGCPVVSSLSGADFVVLVTEPTISGLHDLKRVYELVKKFKIKAGCIINKSSINSDVVEQIIAFLKEESIEYIASLPYDTNFTNAMIEGKTIVEYDQGILRDEVVKSWERVKKLIQNL